MAVFSLLIRRERSKYLDLENQILDFLDWMVVHFRIFITAIRRGVLIAHTKSSYGSAD
jgi:hypothetical protein